MNLKKMIRDIGNSNVNLQERLFRLIMMISVLAWAVPIIFGVISKEPIKMTILRIVSFVIFYAVIYLCILYKKTNMIAAIIAAGLLFVIFPYVCLQAGGIYRGAPFWFVLGVVYVCLVVESKIKYIILIGAHIVAVVCYYFVYTHPELMVEQDMKAICMDSGVNLILISGLTCGMILFQNAVYRYENLLVQKQKKEIEELNQTQNRFFSSMSHEIRTPINTIIGLNEMILREDVSDEVAADAKNIQGASKMLLTLINDILDMSKIESGKMDIVPVIYDVGDMLSDIVNMIWVRAKEKGLEFHVDVDQAMPSQLYGDEVRIKQILINVLNNAVKYTSEGSVTLSIQCEKQENGRAVITYSVKDTGMGIKKESIPYLFSAFKRIDEEKNRYIEGTGLGLSIVKQLVELMDGEIAVNSVYTKGSTFVINIPQGIVGEQQIGNINIEERHALNARQHYKQSFVAPKAQILIVDDNDTNLMVEKKLLRETQVNIDTACSGRECLIKTLEKRYDIIFMDHLMPEMDGIECLHEIVKQVGGLNHDTPVVILTANAGGENQALYRREGFDGYLLKPVSGIQLETELLRHLPKELVKITNAGSLTGMEKTLVLGQRQQMLVKITTESVCDLPAQMKDKHQIAAIPYRVVTEGGEFLDGLETETDGVLSYIEEKGKRVHSQEPTVEAYEEFFAEQLTKAQHIIHIALANHVGKGYENALEAARAFDNVYVINSGHLSSGMGLMVLQAAEYAEAGMSVDEIIKKIERMKTRIKTSFIVNSTEYLAKAERIPEKVDSICKAFMIHPVIVLKNSYMKVGAVRIGTKNFVWKKYIESTLSHMHNVDKRRLFITYAGLSNDELLEIRSQVEKKAKFESVIYQKASPSISANCGPGTFGLLFQLKDNTEM